MDNNVKFVMTNKCLQNYKGTYILETCNDNYITQQFNSTDEKIITIYHLKTQVI